MLSCYPAASNEARPAQTGHSLCYRNFFAVCEARVTDPEKLLLRISRPHASCDAGAHAQKYLRISVLGVWAQLCSYDNDVLWNSHLKVVHIDHKNKL